MNNTKKLEHYLMTDYDESAKICLDQNKSKIDALYGVENYFIGLSSDSSNLKPIIVINSSLTEGGEYPETLLVTLNSGKTLSVPVEVIYGFNKPKAHFGTGNSVSNFQIAQVSGTICCGVQKDDKKYFLTCAHVLTGGISTIDQENTDGWFTDVIQNDIISSDLSFNSIGTWSYGLITTTLDIALVETNLETDSIAVGNPALAIYRPAMINQQVFVHGNRNQQIGYIRGFLEKEIDFEYNGSTIKHSGLIMISGNKSPYPIAITEPGDSGALVCLTKDNTPVGMVVGGNDQYTYIMPMQAILDATKTNLI